MEAASYLPGLSKIAPPRLPPVLHRPRLDEWLEANHDKSIIFVVGQAAQGKSTVAASWANRSHIPSAWLSLDVESSDPVNLFHSLIQSLQHTLHETDFSNLMDYTSVNMGPREKLPPYREWCKAIFRKISCPFQIFFDGLDRLSPDAPSFRFLQVFIDELPANGRIIAVSRSLPPLQVQRLKMARRTAVLDNDRLAFTAAETGALFKRLGTSLGAQQLRMIQELTEGWAGGLVLLSEVLKGLRGGVREQFVAEGISRTSFKEDVFGYLGEQVFSALPSHVRDLLVKLSLLDVIEPDFVKDLLGIGDAAQIMEDLVKRNLFVQCLQGEGNGRCFRLHQLFRDFLSVRLRSETTREERLNLAYEAGALYERYGSPENAVRYYLESGAHREAARVMEKEGVSLLKAGRLGELAHWLQLLPVELIRQSPWLLFYLCMTRRFSGVEENVRDLQQALDMFEQRKDSRGRLLSLAYIIEAMIMRGRFSIPICELIAKAEAEVSSLHGDDYDYEKVTLLIQVGLGLVVVGGEPHKAVQACMTAISMAKKLSIVPLQLNALIHCTLAFSSQAEFSSAREICERAEELLAKYPCAELQCYYWIISSVVYSWSGELQKAESLVQMALKQTEELGLVYLYPLALLYYVLLAPHVEEFGEAERVASRLIDITASQGNRMFSGLTTLLLGISNYFRGEIRRCMELLDEAESILSSPESRGESQLNWVKLVRCLASLHLEPGQWVDSGQVKEAFTYFSSISDSLRMAECCLAMALLEAQRGNPSEAEAHLQTGLSIAEERGYTHFSFTSREDARKACILALELNVEPASHYAVHLLVTRFGPHALPGLAKLASHRNPAVRSRALEAARNIRRSGLPRLGIETFGGLRVSRGATLIKDSEWGGKQPKALLKALIARGAFGVPKEALIEDLWPETEAAPGERIFKVILHRLRKTLEPLMDNTAGSFYVHLRKGLLWLDEELCMVDALTLPPLLETARKKEAEGDLKGALSVYEQAEKLYKGDFLPEELSIPRVDLRRDELRKTHFDILTRIAWIHDRRGSSRKAITCLKKVIQADPLFEPAYQQLIALYSNRGMRSAALRTYEEYGKILQTELGTEPDELTTSIYRKICDT